MKKEENNEIKKQEEAKDIYQMLKESQEEHILLEKMKHITVEEIAQAKKEPAQKKGKELRIIPLGGLGEVGKNMTVFELNGKILIVDCGVSFPETDHFGQQLIHPDFSFLKGREKDIEGLLVTHGHEDHIGGIPFFQKEFPNIPIYTGKITGELILRKIKDRFRGTGGNTGIPSINPVYPGDRVKIGEFQIEIFAVAHSISDSFGFILRTEYGNIVHMGDWKIDFMPLGGVQTDLKRLARLSQEEGIKVLLCDSTNAEREIPSISEKEVIDNLEKVFLQYRKNRIIITTFASNFERISKIMGLAKKYHRKVFLNGRSMVGMQESYEKAHLSASRESRHISFSESKFYPDEQSVILCTGSQGEFMSALYRMAIAATEKNCLKPNDVIVFSSSTIPGNEKEVSFLMGEIKKITKNVLYDKTKYHSSGHATAPDIRLLLSLTRPEYYFPVHGEMVHLNANKQIAMDMGMPNGRIFIGSNGGCLLVKKTFLSYIENYTYTGEISVLDFGSLTPKDQEILSQRQSMAKNGVMVIAYSFSEGKVSVSSSGYIDQYDFLKNTKDLMQGIIKNAKREGKTDLDESEVLEIIQSQFTVFSFPEVLFVKL